MVQLFLFIGTTELLLIGGMALLLFGGKKLPEMMRGLGQGVKEFKKGMGEIKNDVPEDSLDESDVPGTGARQEGKVDKEHTKKDLADEKKQ